MQAIKPKVLLSCLNWGLGHATRCIPVINELIKLGVDITLSAEGGGKKILQQYFPGIPFVEIPGIEIKYPRKGSMAFSMLTQLPGILSAIRKEHEQLDKLIRKSGFTHVISDNRYGLYSDRVKTAFICHQVNIMTPAVLKFTQPVLKLLHKKKIEKFNELWIPDIQSGDQLSGELSGHDHIKIPVRHLGMLSRFEASAKPGEKKYDYIALLSGPEPQRSILENKLTALLKKSGKKSLLVKGIPDGNTSITDNQLEIISGITDENLIHILHPDTCLMARPGYSTLMDVSVLQHRNLVLIPTPGQTEQEYLAGRLKTKYGVTIVKQHELFELPEVGRLSHPLPAPQPSNIQSVLKSFLEIEDIPEI
jgi:predicted glycosyltransferase